MSRNVIIGGGAAIVVAAILIIGFAIGGPEEGDTGGLAGTSTEQAADPAPETSVESVEEADPAPAGNGAEPLPKDGPAIPDIGGPDLVTGEQINFPEFIGKPTIVQMWASWCHVCEEGADDVRRFTEERGDVNYIGIDVSDSPDNGRDFIAEHGWTFPSIDDDATGGELAQTFGLTGTPTFVFIHADGTIAGRVAGDPGYENLNLIADRLIASI